MFDAIFPKHWTTLQRLMWLKTNALARAVYETITGNPVSFTAKAAPLKQLEVAFSPVQDLHGYDAPWPAGGHYNQWDEEWEVGAYNASGTPSPVTDRMRCKNKIPVIGGAKYRYISSHGTYFFVAFFESDMTPLQTTVQMNPINTEITAPATAAFMLFYTDAAYGATYLHDIAINYPSSVTTYSPYSNICPISGWDSLTVYHSGADTSNPQTISITLGSTVYSGTLDVLTGVVTVDKKCVTLVGGASEQWGNYSESYGAYRVLLNDANINGKPIEQLLSNQFVGYNSRGIMLNWESGKMLTFNSPLDNIQVFFTTDITDKQGWLAWLAANPTQLVYPLATPITIQLTPQEVQSLAGDNTMWSNANQPITVEYRKN